MCKNVRKQNILWDKKPEQRVPVGYIDEKNHYILLSDEINPNGQYYDIWIPTIEGIPNIIDTVTRQNRKWYYTREYECNDLDCCVKKYLNLINPKYV